MEDLPDITNRELRAHIDDALSVTLVKLTRAIDVMEKHLEESRKR